MVSNDVVYDAGHWLSAEEALVKRVYEALDEYVGRGHMVLKAWFMKTSLVTSDVLSREKVYLSSLKGCYIDDWY